MYGEPRYDAAGKACPDQDTLSRARQVTQGMESRVAPSVAGPVRQDQVGMDLAKLGRYGQPRAAW